MRLISITLLSLVTIGAGAQAPDHTEPPTTHSNSGTDALRNGKSVNFGTWNMNNMDINSEFSSLFVGNTFTNALVGAIKVPSTATQFQVNGVTGMIDCGGVTECVGVYGQAVGKIARTHLFGANFLVSDTKSAPAAGMQAAEFDVNINNASSVASGVLLHGELFVTPAVRPNGFRVIPPGGGHGGWATAFYADPGAAEYSIFTESSANSGKPAPSMLTGWRSYDTDGASHLSVIFLDKTGQLNLGSSPSKAFSLTSSTTGNVSGVFIDPNIGFNSNNSGLFGLSAKGTVNIPSGKTAPLIASVWAQGPSNNYGAGIITVAAGVVASAPTIGVTNYAAIFNGKVKVSSTVDANSYSVQGKAGATCSGPPTANFAVVNGIITHC